MLDKLTARELRERQEKAVADQDYDTVIACSREFSRRSAALRAKREKNG